MKKSAFSYSTRRKITVGIAVAILALLILFRSLNFFILAMSAVTFIFLFHLVDSLFDIRFKGIHYAFAIAIAVLSFLLWQLYTLYPTYDKILHFAQPIMVSSIMFYMINKLKIQRKYKLFFTFFVVVGFVGLFEVAEYTLDLFFNLNLQGVFLRDLQNFSADLIQIQAPLDDTMIDISLGVLGAFLYVVYIKFFTKKN